MNESEMAVPHLFRCPISLDLLKDPVTLCTGQTYDRSSIEEWLAAGNLTCPVTMQRLHDPSIIVPNHALRHLIDRWLELGGRWLDHVCEIPDPDPSLVSLKDDLESEGSSPVVKLRAIQKAHDLCLEFPSKARELVRLGLVPLLLRMVFGRTESDLLGERVSLLEQALGCTLSLLDHGVIDDANVLVEASMLRSLTFFLDHGSSNDVAIKVRICRLVEKISKPSNSGLCATLGQNRGFLNSMISLLQQNSEVSESAVRAMQSLCCIQSNRENLIREGALEGLILYISSSKKSGQSRLMLPPALTTIERLLLEVEEAKWAILSDPDGVPILVEMVFRVSGHETSESAVGSLTILCGDSSEAREEAIRAGAVTQLLFLIQSQCSGRIKTKARELLKMLRS